MNDLDRKNKILNALNQVMIETVSADFYRDVYERLETMNFIDLAKVVTEYESFKNCLMELKAEVIRERRANSVMISQMNKSWVCGRKHRILHYKQGFKRVKSKGKSSVNLDRREELKCANCKKYFQSKDKGFSSCLNSCDVYMCAYCSVCPLGHGLQWFTEMPDKPGYQIGGAYCDLCREKFNK